ncbi:MAG: PDZ domain-containing protein [Peptococcia bacterium]
MTAFGQIFILILQNILWLLANPLYWVVLLLVVWQHRRIQQTSQRLFAEPADSIWPAVLAAVFYGFIGGILGSLLMLLVGVSIWEVGIAYLWVIAMVLMLIRQRFLCFSYSGGLIAISNLLFGFPKVSIPHLMGLVAILHLVEAWLIYVTGPLFPVPVYVKTREGQIVGGYNLQKFWPLPFVAFVALQMPNSDILIETIKMPEWWPLLQTEIASGSGELVYAMAPVLAALGYGDIAVSQDPRTKTRRSALELAGYSLILLGLSILASHYPSLAFLAAFYGPLGHEALIIIGQKRELTRSPRYVRPFQGLMLLHVKRNSPFWKAGVKSGDIILRVNGQEVDEYSDLLVILQETGSRAELEYLSGQKRILKRCLIQGLPNIRLEGSQWLEGQQLFLGIIPVPQGQYGSHLIFSGSVSLLKRCWNKLSRKMK